MYKRTRHGSRNGHKFGDHWPDRDYDKRNHWEYEPCLSPWLPRMSDLQLFWMESALSRAARDWHSGYRGSVVDGIWELTEGDLQALHVPPDTAVYYRRPL